MSITSRLKNVKRCQSFCITSEEVIRHSDIGREWAEDHFSLLHYGVKGMKWGVRRGPPYPIGSGEKQGSSLLAYYVTLLAVTSATSLVKKQIEVYNYQKKTGILTLKKKQKRALARHEPSKDFMEDCRAANPKYSLQNQSTSANCGWASMTFCLRRKGYDVQVKDNLPNGSAESDYKKYYSKKIEFNEHAIKTSSIRSINSSLNAAVKEECPSDGYGMVLVSSKVIKNGARWGHAFNFVKEGEKVTFVDSQEKGIINETLTKAMRTGGLVETIKVARMDHLEVDEDTIKSFVEDRK